MAVVNPHVHTEQEVLNSSFDETTGLLITLGGEYDPSGAVKRAVTGNLATKIVIDGVNVYVGKATIGSATSAAVWQVKRIDTTSPIVITWADANDSFDNVMDNATSLSYS